MLIDLCNFEIYKSPQVRGSYELVPLHTFDVNAKKLSVNGTLSFGNMQRYIKTVPIDDYSIEGYDDSSNPTTTVYLTTSQAKKDAEFDIWYRLTVPLPEYVRFHSPFCWVATFGKHFLDYLGSHPPATIGLTSFQVSFYKWLSKRFACNHSFQTWFKEFGRTDFRIPVNAYIAFLERQASNLSNSKELLHHPVWEDCSRKELNISCGNTVATPIVKHCFQNSYFGAYVDDMPVAKAVRKEQDSRKLALSFPKDSFDQVLHEGNCAITSSPQHRTSTSQTKIAGLINIGDVVVTRRDERGQWKASDDEWLSYVQRIEPLQDGIMRLYVIWLYRPTDTTISTATYPFEREMFFSDNCNCTESPLLSADVVRKVSVDWHPRNLNTTKDIFIRQKYVTNDTSFVTLKDSDLRCRCGIEKNVDSYSRGDCVYVSRATKERTLLEPVIVTSIYKATDKIKVRRLCRLRRDCLSLTHNTRRHTIEQNELVWTEEFFIVCPSHIKRRCHIRFFPIDDVLSRNVPLPYNQGGNGDFWIISTRIVGTNDDPHLGYLTEPPCPMKQGPDFSHPEQSLKPLLGLSIFSGGGNFDRGLEDGGPVEFQIAIDISGPAVRTQRANARHDAFQTYWGSVDDYLRAVLAGNRMDCIARVGKIQFIAAGSPCQGFSPMQPNTKSEASLRNASHVTSFCSFVDIYRPEYAVLENVINITDKRKGFEGDKVFSQIIACLVGLGYQTQQFLMDAWCYSSSQHRSRLFISVAAPGMIPIPQPPLTHAHPSNIIARSLGKLPNGERFGGRENYATPFEFATVGEAARDLPDIGSGTSQTCIPYPDHRAPWIIGAKDRIIMERIPRTVPGQGYVEAMHLNLIPHILQKHNKKEFGKSFRRLRENGKFPTITTNLNVQDNRCGGVLHWDQPRMMSIQEARRAQGIPDNEVIIGKESQQFRIIGNGVDRNVALILGLSLRQAWESS
ncbi:S-adenosyl-L-methionine-dependent methyltransferase, partial [Lindgomyces ingoldianus]